MRNNSVRSFGAFLLAVILLPASTRAVQQIDYLPLSKSELRKTFSLIAIGKLERMPMLKKLSIGPSGGEVRVADENLIIEGKDSAGKRWTVQDKHD